MSDHTTAARAAELFDDLAAADVAAQLNAEGFRGPEGRPWRASDIPALLDAAERAHAVKLVERHDHLITGRVGSNR